MRTLNNLIARSVAVLAARKSRRQHAPLLSKINAALEFPVHDPVHKRIWLTELELKVIDTPEFQRLRRVSQLGLADYVFPAATRTRFSHSLGVVYVMGELLRAQKAALADHLAVSGVDWRVLRLAALLHDIGHLPFSHPAEMRNIRRIN